MSNYAIIRVEKRKTAGAAAMARHALRDGQAVDNADEARRADNSVLVGPGSAAGIMARIRDLLPAKRRKDAVTCLDLFVGASPEAMHAMTREQQDAYFRQALAFIGDRFGGRGNIVSAVIHRDETTPHMQVLLVPLLDGKLNAKKLVGNRPDLVRLQDDFAAQVGEPAGLRRGERGSPAKHTSIRQFYGAIQAAGGLDALPPRKPVPDLPKKPEKPGLFASRAAKAAYEQDQDTYQKAVEARRAAIEANKARQDQIEKLARLSLATHGRGARRAPIERDQLEALRQRTQDERAQLSRQVEQARQELTQLAAKRVVAVAEVQKLAKHRDALLSQVDELDTQIRDMGAFLDAEQESQRERDRER